MSSTQNFGVNLSTGKISFPITLGHLSGPNGFGSTISLNYSTTGLVNQVTTWNEDAPTGIVGLGWSLQSASTIMRSGTGSWQDSFFIMMGNQTIPLLLACSPLTPKDPNNPHDPNGDFDTLVFVTQSKSLYKITYDVPNEIWTLIDQDGNVCTYGGIGSDAVDLGVRWVSQEDEEQPAVWVGSSIEASRQENYAVAWRLAQKTTLSGQKVTYTWSQIQQSISPGSGFGGLNYTMANYLTEIQVVDGSSVSLTYTDKESNEYPVFRWRAPQPNSLSLGSKLTTNCNAFQDRIETKYLESLAFYDVNNELQHTVNLGYELLYQNFDPQPSDSQLMDKRLLTNIETVTPQGIPVAPPQKFDYWGLSDQPLQSLVASTSINGKSNCGTLRGLSNKNISTTIESYNALFGHLKTIQSPQGGLTWYSYADSSKTSTAVAGKGWALDNRASDILNPPPATSSNISWALCQPYWGEDNYVTIRWNGTSGDQKYVGFQVYEWIGKWIQVSINNLTASNTASYFVTQVHDFADASTGGDYYTRVAMGSGKFMVALTDVKPTNTLLFHRDANTPGLWNLTTYNLGGDSLPTVTSPVDSTDQTLPVSDPSFNYVQLCLDVGNNIAALLDVINGKLYLFSLVNNAWSLQSEEGTTITDAIQYKSPYVVISNYITCCSSLCVVGDDALVFSNKTTSVIANSIYSYPSDCSISYQLHHYDKTNSSWITPPAVSGIWNQNVIDDLGGGGTTQPLGNGTYVVGMTCGLADGFIALQIVVNYNPGPIGTTLISRPAAVSWDEQYKQLNIQKIYSPNDAHYYAPSGSSVFWGDVLQKTPWPTQGNLAGTITTSNLVNISTGTGSPRKYVARYVGGEGWGDSGYNSGWLCDPRLSNINDNSDLWEQMASFDTTIAINKSADHDYIYQFYQFQPYIAFGQLDPGPGWTLQSAVEMGAHKDWDDIEHIIQEVDFFVKMAVRVALTIATFGESLIASEAIRTALTCAKVALRLSNLALNNPLTHLLERSIFEKALSHRRMGGGNGKNYLLVGTDVDGNSKKNAGGAPTSYYKSWDTENWCWSWAVADPSNLMSTISVPTIQQIDTPYFSQIYCLSSDVYRYGSSFIPFSYMSYLERDVQSPLHEGVVRNIYADQVAFFRNGILSDLIPMPTFQTDQTYVNPIYTQPPYNNLLTDLQYTCYQSNTDPFTLYAPWGGILAYQPQVYTKYCEGAAGAIWDDVIFEGSTGATDWGDSSSSQGLPNPPDLQKSVEQRLYLAQDQMVQGPVSDFVVNKIAVDDGIQVFNAYINYISDNVTYQSGLNSVVYNQVQVASGGSDYATASQENGWTEYYHYSGSSPLLNVQGTVFPYDPATDQSNPLYASLQNHSLTNATNNLNNLLGECYAIRSLKYDPNNPKGIEMSRQYNYYTAYIQNVGAQQVQGVAVPLTLTFTAADNAQSTYIQDSTYTSSATYAFYDVNDLNGSNTLTGLETGLLLSKQSTSNHLMNGTVQPQIQITSNTYGFQTADYGAEFQALNLYSPVVQTITSQTSGSNPTQLEVISSSATVWAPFTSSSGDGYWYPFASYTWSGSSDGTPSATIPWTATTPSALKAGPDWQLTDYAHTVYNGILQSSVQVSQVTEEALQGIRTTTLYDATQTLPIAVVSSANLVNSSGTDLPDNDIFLFSTFENYEDLSSWAVADGSGTPQTGTSLPLTQDTCYAGQQSIKLSYGQFIFYELPEASSSLPDQMVLSFFYAPSTTVSDTHIRVWVRANQSGQYTTLLTQPYNLQWGTSYAWGYQQILLDLKDLAKSAGVTGPYGLWIGFSWGGEDSPNGYLDAVSLVPVGATLSATIYNSLTRLPKACFDENGLTQRFFYDSRYNVIGTTKGRCETETPQSLFLKGYAEESFGKEPQPNFSATISARNGGNIYDFRTVNDPMGWDCPSGPGNIANQQLKLLPGCSISQDLNLYIDQNQYLDFALRINFTGPDPTHGTVNLYVAGIQIDFIALDGDTPSLSFSLSSDPSFSTTCIIPSSLGPIFNDWLLVANGGNFYFYLNGQLIFQKFLETIWATNALSVMIMNNSSVVIIDQILILQNITMDISFLDGTGKKRQTQSIACTNNPAVLITENLYDLKGRNAFNTVVVEKGEGALYQNMLGFEPDFVSSRNPAEATAGDFWEGGTMNGLVTDWANPTVYDSQDKSYLYTGSYYENDPMSRVDKISNPGAQFSATTFYTPQYCYGQYENLPHSSIQSSDITGLLNKVLPNLSTDQIENLYAITVNQIALNSTLCLTNLSLTELSGKGSIHLSLDQSNNYVLSNLTYQIKAEIGQNGMPIMAQIQYCLPNTYDNSGNISASNAANFLVQAEMTSLGQITYASSPDQGAGRAYYDGGRLLRFTQNADQAQANVCLAYLYDGENRLTQVYGISLTSWDISILQDYLDKNQEPSHAQLIRQYTYDVLPSSQDGSSLNNSQGCLVMLESWNVSLDLTVKEDSYVKEVYTYNSSGHLSSAQITNGTNAPYLLQYEYNSLGQGMRVIYPNTLDTNQAVSGIVCAYNPQGTINQIGRINSDGTTDPAFYASYTYNPDGTIATETLSQGQVVRTYHYNTLKQLTRITDNKGLFTETLDYTDSNGIYQDGNIQQADYSFSDGNDVDNYIYQYKYDSFGRLTSAQANISEMPSWQLYAANDQGDYDANGNLYGAQGVLNTFIPGTNQLRQRGDNQSTYDYTATGRVASITLNDSAETSFTYMIDRGRPITVGQTQLIYNAQGERIHKQTSDMTIEYYRQGSHVLQENVSYHMSGNTYRLSYIYGLSGLIALEVTQTAGNDSGYDGTYSILTDSLGSVRAVYNHSMGKIVAYINYSAWGSPVSANSSTGIGEESDAQITGLFRYLYTGQEWDSEMSLYNYHARQYDPSLGRFLTPDPDHQTPSPYLYCANNPINYTDPTGRMFCDELAESLERPVLLFSRDYTLLFSDILDNNTIFNAPAGRLQRQLIGNVLTCERGSQHQDWMRYCYTRGPNNNTLDISLGKGNPLEGDPNGGLDGTTGFNLEMVSGEDTGLRFLPYLTETTTYMTLDGSATRFVTGPFSGCDFAAASAPDLGTTVFHACYSGRGVLSSAERQRQSIVSLAESLGYNQDQMTHYMPGSSYLVGNNNPDITPSAFVTGEYTNNSWSFSNQVVNVAGDGNDGFETIQPLRVLPSFLDM